jgi:hypothetical protein
MGTCHAWATIEAEMASERVLGYIDSTVQSICDELQVKPYGKPSITLKRITKLKPRQHDEGNVEWEIESREVTYCFPGKTRDEAWRFCQYKIPLTRMFLTSNSMSSGNSERDPCCSACRCHCHQKVGIALLVPLLALTQV